MNIVKRFDKIIELCQKAGIDMQPIEQLYDQLFKEKKVRRVALFADLKQKVYAYM